MFGFKLTATAFDQPTPAGTGLAQGDTVARMFWDGVARRGDRVALRQKDFGIWKPLSWNELGDIVREVAMGLVALGYQPGEVASVLSNTNREWIYAGEWFVQKNERRTQSQGARHFHASAFSS